MPAEGPTVASPKSMLYFGDNLDFLRDTARFPDNSIDLIYLDPPFNSNRAYNVIFKEKTGAGSEAQIQAFEDVWYWDEAAAAAGAEAIEIGGPPVANALRAFESMLDGRGLRAYLSTMAARLVHLRRVLRPTGSIYLHCDPTASHYLKLLMDAIFGEENFRNEIIWHYRKWPTGRHSFQSNHDVIFFYTKEATGTHTFNELYMDRAASTLKRFGNAKIVSGHDESGKRIPSQTADEPSEGVRQDDVWDIGRVPPIKQRFPTEKPTALLDRIISASSKEGDTVLDPFCGCGTTVAVAQKLKRRWIGMDITYIAIGQIEQRLREEATQGLPPVYEVVGKPKTVEEARALSLLKGDDGRYQFQYWALDLVGATYLKKKGADRGVDGKVYFQLSPTGPIYSILVQAKSGSVDRSDVATLKGDLAREDVMGVLVTLEEPTRGPKGMEAEAADAGFYTPPDPIGATRPSYPKIQILSVADLLERGKRIEHPGYRIGRAGPLPSPPKAPPKSRSRGRQSSLGSEAPP